MWVARRWESIAGQDGKRIRSHKIVVIGKRERPARAYGNRLVGAGLVAALGNHEGCSYESSALPIENPQTAPVLRYGRCGQARPKRRRSHGKRISRPVPNKNKEDGSGIGDSEMFGLKLKP